VGLLLCVALATALYSENSADSPAGQSTSSAPAKSYNLQTPSRTYDLEVAVTPEEQSKGLGGRETMRVDAGMIFWYPDQAERCFWMKDTRFALDIIWVGSDKRITKLQERLSPDTYPNQFCANARYVIELRSGEAARSSLRVGQRLSF
jgi:hypothetical protein